MPTKSSTFGGAVTRACAALRNAMQSAQITENEVTFADRAISNGVAAARRFATMRARSIPSIRSIIGRL